MSIAGLRISESNVNTELLGKDMIHVNIAVDIPSQVVAFVRISESSNLKELKTKICEDCPRFASQCGWSVKKSARRNLGGAAQKPTSSALGFEDGEGKEQDQHEKQGKKYSRKGASQTINGIALREEKIGKSEGKERGNSEAESSNLDVQDVEVDIEVDEGPQSHCFYVNGAPVSPVQELTLLVKDILPTICVGQRKHFEFAKKLADRGSHRSLGIPPSPHNSFDFQDHPQDGLPNSDFRLGERDEHGKHNRLSSAIHLRDFKDLNEKIEEKGLEQSISIRVLCDGKRVKKWEGKAVHDFVSLLRDGFMTPTNSTRRFNSGTTTIRGMEESFSVLGTASNRDVANASNMDAATPATSLAHITERDGAKAKNGLIHCGSMSDVASAAEEKRPKALHTDPNASAHNSPIAKPKTVPGVGAGGKISFAARNNNLKEKSLPNNITVNNSTGDIVLDGKQIRERLMLRKGSWIDITVSNPEATLWLCRALALHPLTIEDILEVQREKIEVLKPYTFILFKALRPKELFRENPEGGNQSDFIPLRILLYKDLLVTIHPWQGLFKRIRSALPTLRRERKSIIAKVAYFILDSETEAFVPHVQAIMGEVDALENLVYVLSVSEKNDLLRRMALCRRRIAQFNQVIWSKAIMLQHLKSQRFHMEAAEGLPVVYLQDILDTITFMTTRIKLAREFLDGAQSTYLARVSVEAADHSSEIEGRMNTLSSVATIFVPLTTITGMWGMNVVVPGQVEDFDPSDATAYVPFVLICIGMLFVTVFLSYLFRRYELF